MKRYIQEISKMQLSLGKKSDEIVVDCYRAHPRNEEMFKTCVLGRFKNISEISFGWNILSLYTIPE